MVEVRYGYARFGTKRQDKIHVSNELVSGELDKRSCF